MNKHIVVYMIADDDDEPADDVRHAAEAETSLPVSKCTQLNMYFSQKVQ